MHNWNSDCLRVGVLSTVISRFPNGFPDFHGFQEYLIYCIFFAGKVHVFVRSNVIFFIFIFQLFQAMNIQLIIKEVKNNYFVITASGKNKA